jgi:hypothetical protein
MNNIISLLNNNINNKSDSILYFGENIGKQFSNFQNILMLNRLPKDFEDLISLINHYDVFICKGDITMKKVEYIVNNSSKIICIFISTELMYEMYNIGNGAPSIVTTEDRGYVWMVWNLPNNHNNTNNNLEITNSNSSFLEENNFLKNSSKEEKNIHSSRFYDEGKQMLELMQKGWKRSEVQKMKKLHLHRSSIYRRLKVAAYAQKYPEIKFLSLRAALRFIDNKEKENKVKILILGILKISK